MRATPWRLKVKINFYAAITISCITLVITLVIVGCAPEGITEEGEHAGLRISSFSYENHDYIKFDEGYGHGRRMAIIHDPRCHCQVKAEIE